ncbi:hypothetical protein [Methylosinus sporium]|uniref:hypothetical protein n=1 Tax=Methylosinus sporium TaxID=428 RepID=UPI001304D5C1|nr:hypothetical protein [Methylosinus sporium]
MSEFFDLFSKFVDDRRRLFVASDLELELDDFFERNVPMRPGILEVEYPPTKRRGRRHDRFDSTGRPPLVQQTAKIADDQKLQLAIDEVMIGTSVRIGSMDARRHRRTLERT